MPRLVSLFIGFIGFIGFVGFVGFIGFIGLLIQATDDKDEKMAIINPINRLIFLFRQKPFDKSRIDIAADKIRILHDDQMQGYGGFDGPDV